MKDKFPRFIANKLLATGANSFWLQAIASDGEPRGMHWFTELVRGNCNPTPCAAVLGSNLRTIFRTYVGFQGKTAPSKSLRTVAVTANAP